MDVTLPSCSKIHCSNTGAIATNAWSEISIRCSEISLLEV